LIHILENYESDFARWSHDHRKFLQNAPTDGGDLPAISRQFPPKHANTQCLGSSGETLVTSYNENDYSSNNKTFSKNNTAINTTNNTSTRSAACLRVLRETQGKTGQDTSTTDGSQVTCIETFSDKMDTASLHRPTMTSS